MRVLDHFPHRVREIEHTWIPLRDGTRLAARMWLPEGVARAPAVVEYIPYGKRVGTRERDEAMHHWLAGHGYAAVRIDLRGSGESSGVLRDEYLPREQEDGVEAIAWLAAQPWCSGAVGLIGKSWGGFNALQIAARRPPALRAIVTVCSTDDRYADDVHYMGGCLLNDNLWWGAVFFQLCAQPPDPALVGEAWRAMWRERLEAAEPHPLRWIRHPLRDAYWRQGSVSEDYGAIECPVYAVGGWADAYRNAIPRLLGSLTVPARGLIGPWGHVYPHESARAPVGFLQESLRWWDTWLRGEERGMAAEPALRFWMPAPRDPAAGRWVAEDAWPSARIEPTPFWLSPGRLTRSPEAASHGARLEIRSPQTTGAAAGGWLVASAPDQAEDDAHSLCFDSDPLPEGVELLGAPELTLAFASDRRLGLVAVRLCDVSPDGVSTRVTYGLRNLTHRDDHATWAPLSPGRFQEVTVRLNDIAHAFARGHRIRLALSTAYWPLAWPSPEPVTLTVQSDGCRLVLPLRPPDPDDAKLAAFAPAESARSTGWEPLEKAEVTRRRDIDRASGELVAEMRSGYGAAGHVALGRCEPIDLEGGDATAISTRIHADAPLRARAVMSQRTELRRDGWRVAVETDVAVSCTLDELRVEARLSAYESESELFVRRWDERVPREGF
ncbi:MAG TPA: CocE/NonD family hydrolase [Myxococcota bacterium]|nr:CocE/NonD family hydrolase [Myxococcota bacterium]